MITKIKGTIKHYAWGGLGYLPNLLGENPDGTPWAEYWLGTHPLGESQQIPSGKSVIQLLAEDNIEELPYLLKILDVQDMLSIQVHPTKDQATSGYRQEEEAKIPPDAFHRTFKDRNHKPELMVALSDFYLVQGFKRNAEIYHALQANPELSSLKSHLSDGGIKTLYQYIMTADQEDINQLLQPLGSRIKPLYERGELKKSDINFWAARAFLTFNRKGRCDRGILSLYLMNLVHLKRGEGVFQAPGVLHAYMEGQNVECMANSDNVIRGGLTQKYIDVHRLLEIINYDQTEPLIIHKTPDSYGMENFVTPAEEFCLHMNRGRAVKVSIDKTPSIVLCMEGSVNCQSNDQELEINAGESILITSPADIYGNEHSWFFLAHG